ncbi:MAG: DUF503 domain-containing protein [Actinomycetota bacterium]|nr:DUF503 domain-containing protein [Actinomycetota bacterium]
MHVAHLRVDLHIPTSHSLKEKRAVVKPILEGARRRFQVAAAEVEFQGKWQRTTLGFAAVGAESDHLTTVLQRVERFVWSFPEVEVLSSDLGFAPAWDDA